MDPRENEGVDSYDIPGEENEEDEMAKDIFLIFTLLITFFL